MKIILLITGNYFKLCELHKSLNTGHIMVKPVLAPASNTGLEKVSERTSEFNRKVRLLGPVVL